MKVLQLRLKTREAPIEVVRQTEPERQMELLLLDEDKSYLVAKVVHSASAVRTWFERLLTLSISDLPPNILCAEKYPTLSNALTAFYATAPDELKDSEWDRVLKYRQDHDIVFAFRGCQVSSFCIGIWNNRLTVSWPEGSSIPNALNGAEVSLSLLVADIDSLPPTKI